MTKLEQRLAQQVAAQNVEMHRQTILIEDLHDALKAMTAERDALKAIEPELPMGDARPGHEGEANGAAHH